MKPLAEQSCQHIAKGSPVIAQHLIDEYLPQIPQWLNIDNKIIERNFKFKDYHQTIAFVHAVADIAHHCDHHPDMLVSYNSCTVTYTTHAVDGLSSNDFICAAKIDRLLDNENS